MASHFFYTELFSLLVNIVVAKKNRLRFCACASVASLLLENINNPVMVVKEVRWVYTIILRQNFAWLNR